MNLDMKDLQWMLTLRRKYNTAGELKLCRWLDKIEGMQTDEFGNRIITVGDNPTILFSSHTDTVHWTKTGTQKICVDQVKHEFFLGEIGDCLGADDGAGVWIMTKMIEAKIPGLYIFHRGEECGGLGSSFIRDKTPEILKEIDIAVAFDRRGQKDIITSQSCGKCASEEFAKSLAKQLGMGHSSARGSFTDTANYAGLIRECTNVSVGYEREHTSGETLNYKYLHNLMKALLKVDWSKLEVKRDVTDFGISPYSSYGGYGRGFGNRYISYLTTTEIQALIRNKPKVVETILKRLGTTQSDVTYAEQNIARNIKNQQKPFDEDWYGW